MDVQAQFEAVFAAQGGDEEDWLIEDSVEDSERIKDFEAGKNEIWRVYLGSTHEPAYFKPLNGVNGTEAFMWGHDKVSTTLAEVAAWRLAAALGGPLLEIATPCVLRWIHEIDEHAPGALLVAQPRDEAATKEIFYTAPVACRHAAFFDALIGQQDRHAGNFLTDGQQLFLIDNGFAFGRREQDDLFHCSVFLDWRWRDESQALSEWESGALGRLVASGDLLGLAEMLEESRGGSLRRRAEQMLERKELVAVGEFC